MLLRRMAATVAVTGALALAPALPATSAPVVTGGLVNVTVTNLLNNNQVGVQIPITAAANICGVTVNAIATVVDQGQTFDCTSRSGNQQLAITRG